MKENYEKNFDTWGGPDGAMFENEMLMPLSLESPRSPVSFNDDIDWVKNHQPEKWNPIDPPLKLTNDLHYYIFQNLQKENLISDDIKNLKIYTALGSGADLRRGIDMIVEYYDKNDKKNYQALIDITIDSQKSIDHTGADLVLCFDKNIDRDQHNYQDIMDMQAGFVVDVLKDIKSDSIANKK